MLQYGISPHKMINSEIIFYLVKKGNSSKYETPILGFCVSPYILQCHSTANGIQCYPDIGHPRLRWKSSLSRVTLCTSSCVSCHIPARSGLRLGGPGILAACTDSSFTANVLSLSSPKRLLSMTYMS